MSPFIAQKLLAFIRLFVHDQVKLMGSFF